MMIKMPLRNAAAIVGVFFFASGCGDANQDVVNVAERTPPPALAAPDIEEADAEPATDGKEKAEAVEPLPLGFPRDIPWIPGLLLTEARTDGERGEYYIKGVVSEKSVPEVLAWYEVTAENQGWTRTAKSQLGDQAASLRFEMGEREFRVSLDYISRESPDTSLVVQTGVEK